MNYSNQITNVLSFFLDSRKVVRNCTLDVNPDEDWCRKEHECEKCTEKDGCNNWNARYNWCLVCESDVKGDCGTISDASVHGEQCDKPSTYSYSRSGCFTIYKGRKYDSFESN